MFRPERGEAFGWNSVTIETNQRIWPYSGGLSPGVFERDEYKGVV